MIDVFSAKNMRAIRWITNRCVVALCLLAGFCGCTTDQRIDVTNKPEWWGQLHVNELVRLKADALLRGQQLHFQLVNYNPKDPLGIPVGSPITADMVRAEPQRYWSDLLIIPKGTRLRLTKLERYRTSETTGYLL